MSLNKDLVTPFPVDTKAENNYIGLAFEPGVSRWRRDLSGRVERGLILFCRYIIKHWLLLLNSSSIFFLGAAFLVPLAQGAGFQFLARPVFDFCHLVCVQDASHSFHIGGYQMAVCERCLAIYAAMGLLGVLFHLVRFRLQPLKLWQYGVLALPIALDGFTQLFGWRQSTWELRLLTGALFGFGTVCYMFPQFEAKMSRLKFWTDRELAQAGKL